MMAPGHAPLPWTDIDHVLLDLDGTLLDKYFDDFFWEELLPQAYAGRNRLSLPEAKQSLYHAYRAEEGNLNWSDVDFWSQKLGLNLRALKEEISHLVRLHPDVEPFLKFLRRERKKVFILTNAHPKTVDVKLHRTPLLSYIDGLLCSAEIGQAKEQDGFWGKAAERIGFDRNRSLFVDDNENVLSAAHRFGIRFLIFRGLASSKSPARISQRFTTLESLEGLISSLPPGEVLAARPGSIDQGTSLRPTAPPYGPLPDQI